jgi:gluconolactonase
MNTNHIARWALTLPLWIGVGCKSTDRGGGRSAAPAKVALKNNTNAPMVAENASGTLGSIERLDPALDALLPKDAKIEILAKGLDWSEGPVWSKEMKALLFSDVPQNVVYTWTEQGGVAVHLKPSGYTGTTPRGGEPGSNGLTMDKEGRLTLCQHGDRRVARVEKDGKQTALADRFEGKRFNSPNDVIYDSKGNLLFTDPPYGLEKRLDDPKKEIPFQGVYRVVPGGKPALVTKEVKFPNGLALSPDEKTLYVAESNPDKPVIWAFDFKAAEGTASNQRVFFDASALAAKKLQGLPDGLKVDTAGNLWASCPGGIVILSPAGKHLGSILTGEKTANCAWGDDGSTLYITADMYVCRVRTSARGKMPG